MFNIGDKVFPVYEAGYNRDWYSNKTDWFIYCLDNTYERKDEYDGYTVLNFRTYANGRIEYFVGNCWFFSEDIYATYKEALAEIKRRNRGDVIWQNI